MAVFSLPLILSGLLQLCFNAADMIVVGRFASAESLAAVGSTGPICGLIVTVFMGLSVGANVVVAHFTGARDPCAASRAVHTSIALAVWSGLGLVGVSRFAVEPLLVAMDVPQSVLSLAVLYTLIICAGIPFNMLFNFGAAIQRAVGDTRRPTLYLVYSGVLNVVLNLIFVIAFRMDVMGVALATVASQAMAAALVLRDLVREDTPDSARPGADCAGIGLRWKLVRVDPRMLRSIVRIGVPAGFQGVFYSTSNILILSAVGSLGDMALAGNAAGGNLEGFLYVFGGVFQQAAVSFVGQNFGGGKFQRVRQSAVIVSAGTTVFVTAVSLVLLATGPTLLRLYSTDADAIRFGMDRLRVMMPLYATCPLMEVFGGCLRGLGRSLQPAVTTFLGVCVLRVLWVEFLFPLQPTMTNVMLSYPVSWTLVTLVNGIFLVRALKRLPGGRNAGISAA